MSASARYATEARLRARLTSAKRRLNGAMLAPAMSVLAPLAPAALYASAGIAAGVFAGRRYDEIRQLSRPPELHKGQAFAAVTGTAVANRMYLGQSIEFLTYKNGLEELRAKHGRLSSDVRRQYDNGIIGQMAASYLEDRIFSAHGLIIGSPGQGKSELMLSMALQQIKRGGALIIYDPKNDDKVFARLAEMMRQCGREHDLRYFNPDRPHLSHSYNPLLHGSTRHIVSTGMKLMKTPSGGDGEFFYRMSRVGLLAAIVCLKSQPVPTPIAFKDLAPLFSDPALFARLWRNIPESDGPAREFVYQFLNMWIAEDRDGGRAFNRNRYTEIMGGLKSMLLDYCHTEYYDLLNSYSPDIDIRDVIENGRVLYIGFSALTDKQGSNVFGRLMLADLARAIGEIYTERRRPAAPTLVFMDEYGSNADEADLELFQMARDANVALWVAVQGRGFLDSVNEQFVSKLLDATATQIFLRVSSAETREAAAKLAGSAITRFLQSSESQSFGKSYRNHETGMLNAENHGRSVGTGMRELREDLIQPEDFNMDKGDAIAITSTGIQKLRLPLVTFRDYVPQSHEAWIPRFQRHRAQGLDLMKRALEQDARMIDTLIASNFEEFMQAQ